MGKLRAGIDGLPAEEVGPWVDDKHFVVREYVRICHGVRRRFIGPVGGGATYIDLFCGPGQAYVKKREEFVDGTAVVAWKCAVKVGSPFSHVYLSDKDNELREACAHRLRQLGAPVVEIPGPARDAAHELSRKLPTYGFHFSFLDPYSLGALHFEILRSLSRLKRMDILVHISAMDLYRNIDQQSADDELQDFDAFAPGWRTRVPIELPQRERRTRLMEYWFDLVREQLSLNADSRMHPVRNRVNRLLYWLMLLSRHKLADKFWKIVVNAQPNQTRELFDL
jgi:three-Cys-motif partner protein